MQKPNRCVLLRYGKCFAQQRRYHDAIHTTEIEATMHGDANVRTVIVPYTPHSSPKCTSAATNDIIVAWYTPRAAAPGAPRAYAVSKHSAHVTVVHVAKVRPYLRHSTSQHGAYTHAHVCFAAAPQSRTAQSLHHRAQRRGHATLPHQ